MRLLTSAFTVASFACAVVWVLACDTRPASKPGEVNTSARAVAAALSVSAAALTAPANAADRLGAGIPAEPAVALATIAKEPSTYIGKTMVTTGTVQAVCQHSGCWMTLKDDAQAEAFVRMAGHSFFIPKSANGRKARVHARLVDSEAPAKACGAGAGPDHKAGCREDAEKGPVQPNGKPLAKLELEALGVELF